MARVPKSQGFPIVEAFGYAFDAQTPASLAAKKNRWCPFMYKACEKFVQYGYGYCSVIYSAQDDRGIPQIYAVCDHRVDGIPLRTVLMDHFGDDTDGVQLVPEVVISNPRTSFDYVAITLSAERAPTDTDVVIEDLIVIETQAIDLRGGGVGPAWRAWFDDKPELWRHYFTEEAERKGRKDNVAYGVNMANIYKRLGIQVATKGAYLRAIGVPFYVLMQDRTFDYLWRRIKFTEVEEGAPWDVTFVTFEYTGRIDADGRFEFVHARTVRTTYESYSAAVARDTRTGDDERARFLNLVVRKSGLR